MDVDASTSTQMDVNQNESTSTHTDVDPSTSTNTDVNAPSPSKKKSVPMLTDKPHDEYSETTNFDESPGSEIIDAMDRNEMELNSGNFSPERNTEENLESKNIYLQWNRDGTIEKLLIPTYTAIIQGYNNKPKPGSQFVGIHNRGNQCYCIVAMHVLMMIPELFRYLTVSMGEDLDKLRYLNHETELYDKETKRIVLMRPMSYGVYLTAVLMRKEQQKRTKSKGKQHAKPPSINVFPLDIVKQKKMTLGSTTQEDAHEFIFTLLDMMMQENHPFYEDEVETSTRTPKEFESHVMEFLAIQWKDLCHFECTHKAEHINHKEYCLALTIPTEEEYRKTIRNNMCIQTLLDNYFIKQHFNVEKRFCGKCQKNMNLSLMHIPILLNKFFILHLKRFNGTVIGNNPVTIKNHVQIDIDFEVDIPYYGNKKYQYKLVAVVCHEGEASSGHYTTFIIEENDNELIFNMMSDKTHVVVPRQVFSLYTSKRAYILLYKIKNREKSVVQHLNNVIDPKFENLLKTFVSTFRKKGKGRSAKQTRISDILSPSNGQPEKDKTTKTSKQTKPSKKRKTTD